MSTVLVITPILISSWPAISAAVTAAIGTMGFAAIREARGLDLNSRRSTNRAEIELEDSEIMKDAAGTDEQIVVMRDGITAIFSRDPRGGLRVCVEGDGIAKSELQRIGEELIGRVTQQYAYHRIVTELKARNMTIVDEQMTDTESVKIRVRNW